MQKIKPCLWFDKDAEEAVNFYTTVFKNSKVSSVSRYGAEGPGPEGQVMVMDFVLEEQEFMALNGGPAFQFSPAISLYVNCESQAEVDHLWDALVAGGEAEQCGWLRDRFGVSWQIIPTVLIELMSDPDPAKAGRVMQAMLKMVKIDIAALRRAHAG